MCAERYSRAFTNNKTERLAGGDPRLSIAERYRDHRDYVRAVTRAAKKLVKEGFLLKKDDDRIIDRLNATA